MSGEPAGLTLQQAAIVAADRNTVLAQLYAQRRDLRKQAAALDDRIKQQVELVNASLSQLITSAVPNPAKETLDLEPTE